MKKVWVAVAAAVVGLMLVGCAGGVAATSGKSSSGVDESGVEIIFVDTPLEYSIMCAKSSSGLSCDW